MLRAVRHNLRSVVRLAVLLVLVGLGTVPVECASVYGPHSIFVSAEAVAHVQHGVHDHALGGAPAENGMAGMAMPDEHAASTASGVQSSTVPGARVSSSLPAPAGTAVDALIALVIFEIDGTPDPRDFATITRLMPLPTGSLLPAPEHPPPQFGS